MVSEKEKEVLRGAGSGAAAGVVFAIMEVAGASMMGDPPLMPLRMFASIVLGQAALMETALGTAVIVGIVTHLVLSALFGAIYGFWMATRTPEARQGWGAQAGLGLSFGIGLWLVNIQIIARLLYPWFLTAPQALQLVMHAVFFGIPLGLLFAASERRAAHPLRPV